MRRNCEKQNQLFSSLHRMLQFYWIQFYYDNSNFCMYLGAKSPRGKNSGGEKSAGRKFRGRKVREAKIPGAKSPRGEKSAGRKVREAKNPKSVKTIRQIYMRCPDCSSIAHGLHRYYSHCTRVLETTRQLCTSCRNCATIVHGL